MGKRSGSGLVAHKATLVNALSRALSERVMLLDFTIGRRGLQEHLGHQNFNTTAKYRKVSGKEHRDWYQKLWGKKGS